MKVLTEKIIRFFKRQAFVIVSTVDKEGSVHASCKGIVKIDKKGLIYLLDLYKGGTYANLRLNPHMSITAVDEHKFTGYCLKGKVKEKIKTKLNSSFIKEWEGIINSRITQRVIRNIRGEMGQGRHPEAVLPGPEYLIFMEVEKIVDLTPQHIRENQKQKTKDI